jgi:hypothetical protein
MARLAEIYRQETKTGGNFGTVIAKSLGEKIDPRQVFDRSGVIATMFPALKSYRASDRTKTPTSAASMPSLSMDTSELSMLSEATKITAKNSLVLPSMARDIFLVKENINKLVKATGQKPRTGTDAYFARREAEEAAYESKMKAIGKVGGSIGASNLTSILGAKKDGQSPSTALYVRESKGLDFEDMVPALTKGGALTTLFTGMLGALGPLLLAGGGLALLGALFAKLYKSKGAFLDKEEAKKIDDIAKTGGLAGVKDKAEQQAKLPEFERTKAEIENYEKRYNEGQKLNEKQLEGFAKRGAESARAVEEYKKANNIGQKPTGVTPAPTTPTPAPAAPTTPAAPSTPTATAATGAEPSTSPTQDLSIGDAINSAAAATGVSSQTLAIFGQLESSLGKAVENKLSSARGPFQFIESTWLTMLQKHGKKYGYDTTSMTREEQLNLRYNNRASALMAAEYTKQNAATLGVDPSDPTSVDELYLAHFLGPGGAKRVLSGEGLTEKQKASVMKYNPNIKTGSKEEFLQFAGSKTASAAKVSAVQQIASSSPSTGTMVASASTSVADGRRASGSGGGNVVVDASQKTTLASAQASGKPASAYDKDIVDAIVGASYA